MMTDEQKYMFDVQGYTVIKGALDPDTVVRMRAEMDRQGIKDAQNNANLSRFSKFLSWGPDWRNLIDHPSVFGHLEELIAPKFRLDHAYGMAMSADGEKAPEGNEMHHEANMFGYGCFYVATGRAMHTGLIVVSYALTDIPPGAGGFICIPGSHKAAYPTPHRLYSMKDNPMWRQVPQNAGDVLIFTEALTHGTMPWSLKTGERRSVLMKYCPGYMQWGGKPMDSDIEGLTERQKNILAGPSVWSRPALT